MKSEVRKFATTLKPCYRGLKDENLCPYLFEVDGTGRFKCLLDRGRSKDASNCPNSNDAYFRIYSQKPEDDNLRQSITPDDEADVFLKPENL